jgi:enamine deaminase RidA (YjgF/YER057c/UK114 family)
LGREYDKEEGLEIARNAMLNVLAVLEREIGDLNKVKQPVKILTFIASDNSFEEQPYVANGGSQLLLDLFGADNVPSRSAIGVNVLPGGIPLETEAIFELKED